jgi:ubiquinone/menaquinone biosynthesis C-methylase UbiE
LYYKGKKVKGPIIPSTDFHGYGNKIRSEIWARIPKNRKLRVLDVGTGFGSTVTFLTKRLAKGSEIWTVDPSKEILDNVRKKLAEEDLLQRTLIEFVQADAAKLDFENDYFDVVVSVMVLHHLEGLEAVLNQLTRVTKKGGRILLVDYVPAAGKELEFRKRHHESDFFEPKKVLELMKKTGVSKVALKQVKLWYLLDAKK